MSKGMIGVFLGLLVASSGGCVLSASSFKTTSGTGVPAEVLREVADGRTERAWLIKHLGEPTASLDRGQGLEDLIYETTSRVEEQFNVLLLLSLESWSRRKRRYHHTTGQYRRLKRFELRGWRAGAAMLACGLPVFLGFVLPALILANLAMGAGEGQITARYLGLVRNTLTLGLLTAALAVPVALLVAYALRRRGGMAVTAAGRIAGLGYAIPGSIIAVGVLIPFAAFDNMLDGLARQWFGISTGLLLTGVPTQPAPLWMQLRLGHIGLRPISGLVDLTNYIMADLSQPMHAFDAGNVDRIEVDWAKEGETFRTLDDVERKLTSKELMIQCHGRSIAIAGVMGGGDTEVHEGTRSLLLESANFEPATIRRTATRLGMRTDASARFEKSLDPENTVLAIQRFVELARPMYANMKLAGRLSDCFPRPPAATTVSVDPRHVSRTMGRPVSLEEADKLLAPLGFKTEADDSMWRVRVPSYRAANDVSIEADIIEEIARYVGYDTIEPEMPRVSMRRFAPHALHELEQRTLEYFTSVQRFNEIHGYLWYDGQWLAKLETDPGPCVTLKNPASDGMERMRRDLLPGMLAAVAKNRFYFPAFSMIEVASVFEPDEGGDHEFRHLGLVSARHGKKNEEALYDRLKGAIEGWAWQRFSQSVRFTQAAPEARKPWEHPHRTAVVVIGDEPVGRVSVVDLTLRRLMDEHLASWSVVWAELRLSGMARRDRPAESLGRIPAYPLVEVDVSFMVPLEARYADIAAQLASFTHPLLKSVRYVGSYQGGSVAADRRSITVRAVIGDDTRTLVDDDAGGFRAALNKHLSTCGYEIRGT
ncbi:MAG: hypothetical protein IIC02_03845 [Planctomycetes bacterium]|nr:hypothetical protein [Planctomycetota bacterium]